jgi:P27 family predicted phage terminase small subunit
MPRKSKAELGTPHLVDADYATESPPPPPPNHLSDAAKAWWNEICAEYVLRPHHLKILELAADAWDRTTEARALLRRDGLISSTAAGDPKGHPAAVIERDSRAAFMAALRELDLDSEPRPADKRPVPLYSNRR